MAQGLDSCLSLSSYIIPHSPNLRPSCYHSYDTLTLTAAAEIGPEHWAFWLTAFFKEASLGVNQKRHDVLYYLNSHSLSMSTDFGAYFRVCVWLCFCLITFT